MARTIFIRQSKRAVEEALAEAKSRYSKVPKNSQWCEVDLQLRIGHLESALRNWIDGQTEYTRVLY